jgi:hypothetical protein
VGHLVATPLTIPFDNRTHFTTNQHPLGPQFLISNYKINAFTPQNMSFAAIDDPPAASSLKLEAPTETNNPNPFSPRSKPLGGK